MAYLRRVERDPMKAHQERKRAKRARLPNNICSTHKLPPSIRSSRI
jgi:hypothetical protein